MTQTARIYGGSLYDLAVEEQLADIIQEHMGIVRKLFQENPDYIRLLMEPSISQDERNGLIESAFGAGTERYLVNFLKILCEKGILTEFGGCCEEFTRRYYADHGIAEAVVTSAVALSEQQCEALKEKLEKISGKKISLSIKIDPSVLAGLRVEVEGTQLDGTVQSRLAGVSKKMNDIIM